MRLKLLTNQS